MDLLIIFIAVAGCYYYLKKKKQTQKQVAVEQKRDFGHHPDQKVSYATTIPTDIRRKNAIEAYLNSNRSSIKPLDDERINVDLSEQNSDNEDSKIQKEEITSDDLLVNSQTGEIVTPGMAFSSTDESNSNDDVDNSTVVPASTEVVNSEDQQRSSSDHNSSLNQGKIATSDTQLKQAAQPKDWKRKNDQAINDLLN
ncbi:hypothetical protein ABVC46_02380 [Lactobacillus crispatus]|jgi:hypothetical protein|uniref:Uncharacterized protein n=1 Tax=Lactobacillus crispatus TaxID=47770 RepID=A0AAW8WL86_9LACO|nr:hypothetical protein [Lactobacillus crispatus]MCT7696383.1 hypothetical protein [Lactobacillus crispatus]MCT7707843.1 hypothetical protein [Lactobacillus crispatus]MCZ3785494.1 hypothetical protein [Lactobacillus crispatus]MCZ3793112.1 hypothetical protein [Lactobacillus crispatus]MDT9609952.1 hypothetical protein [Lactobacillus crispatus]